MKSSLRVDNLDEEGQFALATLTGDKTLDANMTMVHMIRLMSKEEVDKYIKTTEKLNHWINSSNDTINILRYAYQDFEDVVERIRKESAQQSLQDGNEQKRRINSEFLSYLSMVRLYVDHSKSKIGSSNENLLSDFNSACSELFDNHFSYRFFDQLRNYAQHVGMPIMGLSAGGELSQSTKKIVYHFEIYFVRESLLSRKKTWTNKVYPDLKAMPKEFSVLDMSREHFKLMNKLHDTAMKLYIAKVKDDVALVKKYLTETSTKPGRACIVKYVKLDELAVGSSSKADIGLRFLPVETLDLIEKYTD